MCHALYIASDKPLTLIEWDEANPGFHVEELQEDEQVVRKQFTLPFVAYVGSFEGCSCGFVYDDEPIGDDEYEQLYDSQAREAVGRLRHYISNLLEDGSVELFACCQGDLQFECPERETIGIEFFDSREFAFDDGKHYTLRV